MIQDIGEHQFYNQYKTVPPDRESYILCYNDKEILVRWKDEKLDFPRFKDLEGCNQQLYDNYTYLFSIDGDRFYLMDHVSCPAGDNYCMENTEVFRRATPWHLSFAGITGAQIYRWYESHRFCGGCQEPMEHSPKERMVYCPKCGNIEYPKISPAVIVAVTDGDRLLLSKYANRNYTRYALLAGFTEIGETVEGTVHREVMEEVGLKVKNLKYYKSQPWSFSDTLLMGFYAELDGSDEITLDEEELAAAQWFRREEIPVEPEHASLTNEMIMEFKRGNICL